jgi:hypothetical protein
MAMAMLLLLCISFAALFTNGAAPLARTAQRQYKYEKRSVDANIENGGRVVTFMESIYGAERTSVILENVLRCANGSQPSGADKGVIVIEDEEPTPGCNITPYACWPRFFHDELEMAMSCRKRLQYRRALDFYVQRKSAGASTPTAMRGLRNRGSFRNPGGGREIPKRRRAWVFSCCSFLSFVYSV